MGVDYGELDLESFVRILIDTGRASLPDTEARNPERKEALQHVIKGLRQLGHAIVENKLSPSELLRALAYAFEIGTYTESETTVHVIKHRGTTPARAKRGELKQATDQILSEIVAGLVRPGDEVHPYKTADAIRGTVNETLEARGRKPVGRDRLARLIRSLATGGDDPRKR